MSGFSRLLLIPVALAMLGAARADPSGLDFEQGAGSAVKEWTLQTSLYTTHFDPEPDHVNDQNLIGIEAYLSGHWLAGVALFDNSFGQSSQLVYAGKTWPLLGSQHWYAKLTGGLVHGYKEPYEDKIPLNGLGVAPVVIPALGFRYGYFVAEANLGGLAVVMVTAGVRF